MSFQSEENKLDWMYKSANSLVNREDYLLGKKIDKSLEQLNAEEKEKDLGISLPKNHVEHECIPPSIRDYNKLQVGEQQVDLQTKLQEDPLVAIKKREEETRKQFLQNPIQLKKIQELLDRQLKRKQKSSKGKKYSKNIEQVILEKLKNLKEGNIDLDSLTAHNEVDLDKILLKKFRKFKDKLSQKDLKKILEEKKPDTKKHEENDSDENDRRPQNNSRLQRNDARLQRNDSRVRRNDSRSQRNDTRPQRNYPGGTNSSYHPQRENYSERRKQLSEEEKEKRRKEMMQNASWRDEERARNVKRYKEEDAKETKKQDYNPEFVHRELLKSANNSSVESRIKSNINSIQRSKGAMDTHFSRR